MSSSTSINCHETKNLKKLLEWCSNNISFYKGYGADITSYPYIDKKIVMAAPDAFCRSKLWVKHVGITSGTSGTPGAFFRDIKSIAAEQYMQDRYFGWNGKFLVILRGEKLFGFSESTMKFYKRVPLLKEMHVSAYHLNDVNFKILVDILEKIPHKCLYAYPSTAYLFADYCIRNNRKLHFEIIALSSEKLFDHQLEAIEKAFGSNVLDLYGQAERVAALFRCSCGNYHEVPGYSYVEYIPSDKSFGESLYEIVGTTVNNRAMPLIRYRTGDIVQISDTPCLCGAKGPNITDIHGRSDDYIDLPGVRLTGTVLNMPFKKARNIIEAQVTQKKDKSIVIRVVRNHSFSESDQELLLGLIGSYLPEGAFRVEYVNEIEKGPNGKFRFVINEGINDT